MAISHRAQNRLDRLDDWQGYRWDDGYRGPFVIAARLVIAVTWAFFGRRWVR